MEKILLHIKNCIVELLHYLLLAMAGQFFLAVINGADGGILRLLPFSFLPLYFYLIRVKIHRFRFFLPLHLLPLLLPSVLHFPLAEKIIFLLMAVLQMMISLSVRIAARNRPDREGYGRNPAPPAVPVVLGIILLMAGKTGGLAAAVIAYVAGYFIYLYLTHFLHYLEINQRTTGNIPAGAIFSAGFPLVSGFTVFCGLVMAGLAERNFFRALGAWLLEGLRRLLRFLFSLIPRGEETASEAVPEIVPSEMFPEEMAAGAGNPVLNRILDGLFIAVGLVLSILFVAAAVYGLVKLIRAAFGEQKRLPDGDAVPSGDIIEKLNPKREKKNGRSGWLFRTPEEKIRKIFWAALLKRVGKNPAADIRELLKSGTARECLTLFSGEEAALVLVGIYEKARYAPASCTGEEVREARKLAGQLGTVRK